LVTLKLAEASGTPADIFFIARSSARIFPMAGRGKLLDRHRG
jgi:hypothetical protein